MSESEEKLPKVNPQKTAESLVAWAEKVLENEELTKHLFTDDDEFKGPDAKIAMLEHLMKKGLNDIEYLYDKDQRKDIMRWLLKSIDTKKRDVLQAVTRLVNL